MKIILASKSPRRRELLSQIGWEFEIIVSECDESTSQTDPDQMVKELALKKAEAVLDKYEPSDEDYMIIGSDTIVYAGGEIMGKPKSREDAIRMVDKLQNDSHYVYTGVAVLVCKDGKNIRLNFAEQTKVNFYPMTREEIEKYVDSGEPMDKAGAYAIQGLCAAYIKGIEGDYANVVGLPVSRLCYELKLANLEV